MLLKNASTFLDGKFYTADITIQNGKIIDIKKYKNIWFPFNNYDSHFKLKADELNLKYKATHIFDDLGNDFFTTLPIFFWKIWLKGLPETGILLYN